MRGVYRVFGALITLASLAFVAFSIRRSFGQLTEDIVSVRFASVVSSLSIVYAAGLQLVGVAWYEMIKSVDRRPLSRSTALAIFNRCQVYKYLPGNVFHMVGRYGFAKAAGASHQALAFSQIGEIAVISFAALTVTIMFSASALLTHVSASTIAVVVALTVAVLLVSAVLASKYGMIDMGKVVAVAIVRVFVIYMVFFLVNGLMAALLVGSIQPSNAAIGQVIGIAAAAWLLGFVIPGAPGGLGAREAVMIGGMTAIGIPASTATAVAIGHRIATVAGDALVAFVEFVIRARFNSRA